MKINTAYVNLLFIAFAVTIAFFVGEGGKNFFLLGIMLLAPLFFVTCKVKFDRVVVAFFVFIFFLVLSVFFNIDRFRASSFFYTFFFVVSFLVLRNGILKEYFGIYGWIKRIKYLIYAYFIVMLLQQFCVFFHLPVINQIVSFDNPWKLSSLALEPSHLPRFLFFMVYAYLSLRKILLGGSYKFKDFKIDKFVWLSYFWCMLTCGSITALLFVLLIFFQGRKIRMRKIILIVLGGGFVILGISLFVNSTLLTRTFAFLNAFSTLSIAEINAVDHSAAYRFAPIFAFLKHFDLTNVHFWLGYGLDYGREYCQRFMFALSGDIAYNQGINIGGMAAFIMDYGIMFILTLGIAVFETVKECKDRMILIVWVLSSLVESINMQMFWFSLILLVCVGYYTKKNDNNCMEKAQSDAEKSLLSTEHRSLMLNRGA